jgi:hypothetical protein
MTPAERYLRLSDSYCDALGGLRWSFPEDGLVYRDGSPFAFNEEIALFLEGFAWRGRCIHFVFILHLFHLLRDTRSAVTPGSQRLNQAYEAAGRLPRNAGCFCALLCDDIPEVGGPLDIQQVLERLRDVCRPIRCDVSFHDTFYPPEMPPLEPLAFEAAVLARLEAYSDVAIKEWLRHGCGPVNDAGEKLVGAGHVAGATSPGRRSAVRLPAAERPGSAAVQAA